MMVSQALRSCRSIPDKLRAARNLLQHFESNLAHADHQGAADEALRAIRRETRRIHRMEKTLQSSRIMALDAIAQLPVTEGEIVAAFYLGGLSIAQIARDRRCGERYVKRCKARAVEELSYPSRQGGNSEVPL